MNAAARLIHQQGLSRQWVFAHFLTRRQFMTFFLGMMVVFSALSIIYVTQSARELNAAYQHNLTLQDRLHVLRGQLLLERSTWLMQARIQTVAEKKLGMVLPDHKSVIVVRE